MSLVRDRTTANPWDDGGSVCRYKTENVWIDPRFGLRLEEGLISGPCVIWTVKARQKHGRTTHPQFTFAAMTSYNTFPTFSSTKFGDFDAHSEGEIYGHASVENEGTRGDGGSGGREAMGEDVKRAGNYL